MWVGYRGAGWGGGRFESEAETPEAAAAECFTEENLKGFPAGRDAIEQARVMNIDTFTGVALKRVGDPTTPEGWERVT